MKKSRPRRQHPSLNRKPRVEREVRVLYEDEAVIVLDKPAGLPAVPVAKHSHAPSAYSLVAAELRSRRERAFVVHRIDRFTSGVILFAKTMRDRNVLVHQFLEHRPLREYVAVIRGHLEKQEGTLVHYFRREGQYQRLSHSKDKKAARAELTYKVERKLREASLVRVRLTTGLQNQIRVQFSAVGHPVIGDRKYHPEEATEKRIDRVALHASRLEFVNPRTEERVRVDSEMPRDMQHLIRLLT